jgi:O-antigen ligase
MYNNENITAQQLCEGLAFCLFIGLSKSNKSRTFLLFIASLFVIPIAATLSRTGFALMLIQFAIFSYARLKMKGVITTAMIAVAVSAIGLVPSLGIITNSKIIDSLAERSAETAEDIRFQLWEISWEIAQENILTGVGFGNYVSDVYRYRIGEKANLGFDGFGSPHNSFIDLIWIGGIWLVLIYTFILLRALYGGIKLIKATDMDLRMMGALIISLAMGVILFSMTAQAATDKRTWLIFAIMYLWIEEGKQRQQLLGSK